MAGFWERADRMSIIGGLFSITALACGVVYYAIKLEIRVDTLENQMRLMIAAPVTAVPQAESKPPGPLTLSTPAPAQTVPNPVVLVCIELMKKVAAGTYESRFAEATAKDYGCKEIIQEAAKAR